MGDLRSNRNPGKSSEVCPECGHVLADFSTSELDSCPKCGVRVTTTAKLEIDHRNDPYGPWFGKQDHDSVMDGCAESGVEEALFEKALELDAHERSEFLSKECQSNEPLRCRLEELLAAADSDDSLLDLPATEGADPSVKFSDASGMHIGNYKLLDKIGEGGMGSVYMAEQMRPVKRMVALKVIRAGLDSKQVVARFEAERQSLALMDHPNIAKVLDAGETEKGEPYFVMELVKGVPITQYCDQNQLAPKDRVRLMIDVCSAVQHAHQKGIIHRDLKPSNILVAQYDDRPVPKVIDFGVAKATHQKLTEKTLYTQLGQIVGTLEYMSPEQAVLNQLDVDTRADVYSLGVILYELLVGETPLDGKELRSQGLEQILKTIREKEPPRPSLRLSSQGKAAVQTAAYRKTDQSSLSRMLRGDLDWVVMKALEKDRKRRYESPSRLGEELYRYLRGDAVNARPPSTAYRVHKFWQQNKAIASSLAAIFLVLTISLGLVSWLWREATTAQGNAERLLKERTEAYSRVTSLLDERNQAITKWHYSIIERGIETALRGDVQTTQEIVSEAKTAKAPEEWIFLLQALAYQFSGRMDLATEILTKAYRSNPESLAIAAALCMSSIGDTGMFVKRDENGQLRPDETFTGLLDRLRQLHPSKEYGKYDQLFRGWTQVYEDPTEAVRTLEGVLNDRERPWPMGQAFYAMAITSEALDTGDAEHARQAVDIIRKVETQLPDNPFVMFVGVLCRCTAITFHDADTDLAFLTQEARVLADKLHQYPHGWAAREISAGFHELADGANDETLAAFSEIHNDWWLACRAAVFFRANHRYQRDEEATDSVGFPIQAIGLASVAALAGRPDDARDIYLKLSKLPAWPVKVMSLEILLLTGDLSFAEVESKRMLEEIEGLGNDFFDPPFWAFQLRLQYVANLIDAQTFLKEADGSKYVECYASYLAGLTMRAQGDEDQARSYFESCLSAGQFWMPQYQFSKTILELEYQGAQNER